MEKRPVSDVPSGSREQSEENLVDSLIKEIVQAVDRISLSETTSPKGINEGCSLVSASLEIAEASVQRPGSIMSDMIQQVVNRHELPAEKVRSLTAIGMLKGEHLRRLYNFLRKKNRELEVALGLGGPSLT